MKYEIKYEHERKKSCHTYDDYDSARENFNILRDGLETLVFCEAISWGEIELNFISHDGTKRRGVRARFD